MPKQEALPLILGAVCLGKSFPIIGGAKAAKIQYYTDLEALALIKKNSSGMYGLTTFGNEVLQQRHDLRSGILAAICSRFDLAWHGRIAAAYVEAQRDCFNIRDFSSTCGLYPDQLALAHHTGFLDPCSPPAVDDVGGADSSAALRALDDAHHHRSELHTAIREYLTAAAEDLSLIHISEPTIRTPRS